MSSSGGSVVSHEPRPARLAVPWDCECLLSIHRPDRADGESAPDRARRGCRIPAAEAPPVRRPAISDNLADILSGKSRIASVPIDIFSLPVMRGIRAASQLTALVRLPSDAASDPSWDKSSAGLGLLWSSSAPIGRRRHGRIGPRDAPMRCRRIGAAAAACARSATRTRRASWCESVPGYRIGSGMNRTARPGPGLAGRRYQTNPNSPGRTTHPAAHRDRARPSSHPW